MYEVLVDDNFNYMDEDERHTLGNFPNLCMALDACREIVDRSLEHLHRTGMTADALYETYTHFGEDPFIRGVPFSAWDYAKARAAELTAPAIKSPLIAPE
jgi:hypothetical protein